MKYFIKKMLTTLRMVFPIHKIVFWFQEEEVNQQFRKFSKLGINVKIYKDAVISNEQNDRNKVVISNNTHIAGTLLVFGYGGEIQIGEDCYVGDHSRIWSGNLIQIGNNVLISHGVNIMDNNGHEIDMDLRIDGFTKSFIYGTKYLSGRVETKPIVIHDGAWIGFNAIILKGVTIGKGAIVASGSLVTKDVAPFTLVAGNPAKLVKHLNQGETVN